MNNEGKRLDPDELLKSLNRDAKRSNRGKLRVFLGMCPGVGKTYSMLEAAKEKQRSGTKIVVGIVETHKRKETEALLEGLVLLPRHPIEYRGKTFHELDVDGILKLKPELVVIDELAHTNTPGSRHPKRYQDVQEILDAGISVYTTVNIQHIESRIDHIKQITGIAVQETVPDSFFELADQIELIDLPPQELLKRLAEGKVYLGEMAALATQNFFKEEHLLALREISLRFTAEVVEDELHEQMTKKQISGPWHTREKLLVAISHSPYSKRLIRAARRMAFNMEATWIALYVDTGETLNDDDKKTLRKNIDLAMELGAELVTTRNPNISSAIRGISEEKNVTQIIMGRPDRRFIRDTLRGGTLLDQLVRETSDIDVHVLRQERRPRFRGLRLNFLQLSGTPIEYYYTFWWVLLLTALGILIEKFVGYQVVGFSYLAGILLLASVADRGPILFGTVLTTFAWNFGFIPPRFSFIIREPEDVMMCLAYFAVALMGSLMTTKIRRQGEELKQREKRTSLLYDFTRAISSSENTTQLTNTTTKFVERTIGGHCGIFLRDSKGELNTQWHTPGGFPIGEKAVSVAVWVNQNSKKAGKGTSTLSGMDSFCLPLLGKRGIVGVLLYFPTENAILSIDQESFLESAAATSAIAFERHQLQEGVKNLEVVVESRKLYQTILDSVSHELRTPITAIIGASTALQDERTLSSKVNLTSLTSDVVRSAQRLNQVIENLLDMSRLSSGELQLRTELVEIGEVARDAAGRWKDWSQATQTIRMEAEESLIANLDSKMLEHVFINLLQNASQYSPPSSEVIIRIKKSTVKPEGIIQVIDEGKPIAAEDRERVFQRFFRTAGTTSGGLGLGLSIVKGIVEAHQGTVGVRPREDRMGNIFEITLPLWEEEVPLV